MAKAAKRAISICAVEWVCFDFVESNHPRSIPGIVINIYHPHVYLTLII